MELRAQSSELMTAVNYSTLFAAQHLQNYFFAMSNPAQNPLTSSVIINVRFGRVWHVFASGGSRLESLEDG